VPDLNLVQAGVEEIVAQGELAHEGWPVRLAPGHGHGHPLTGGHPPYPPTLSCLVHRRRVGSGTPGLKAQGRTAESAEELIKDALAIQEAGAFALLLEAVPPELGKAVAELLTIPVYGIGAGPYTDGQLLINGDMLGYFEAFTPKFVKKYANLAEVITGALTEYVEDVHEGRFPGPEHSYSVLKEELEKFNKVVERYKSSRKK